MRLFIALILGLALGLKSGLITAQAAPVPSSACLSGLQASVDQENDRLAKAYRRLDPASGRIRKRNEGRILLGTSSKAVILLHGFAASPFEMEALALHLNQAGYTAYLPLLAGFGSSVKVANAATALDWKLTLDRSLKLMSQCFSEVKLAGFSTGGTLVADLLASRSVVDPANGDVSFAPIRITSAAVLSPYFKTHIAGADSLRSATARWMDSIDFVTLFEYSRAGDLLAISRHPGFYNSAMPLQAAGTVIRLGADVLRGARIQAKPSGVPIFLAYSESDLTIDFDEASRFVERHFRSNEVYTLESALKVPHQIAILDVNPRAAEMFERIRSFFERD